MVDIPRIKFFAQRRDRAKEPFLDGYYLLIDISTCMPPFFFSGEIPELVFQALASYSLVITVTGILFLVSNQAEWRHCHAYRQRLLKPSDAPSVDSFAIGKIDGTTIS